MVAMTEPRDPPPTTGCAMFGIYSGMFRRRRSASMTSLHRINGASSDAEAEAPNAAPALANPAHHRKAVVHHDSSSLVRRPNAMPVPAAQNGAVARAAAPAANDRSRPATKAANGVGVGPRPAVEPAAEYTGMAAELDKMILDHQRVKGTTQLVRATSGNMMLHRNLGNLNAGAGGGGAPARNSVERGAKAANERKAPNGYAFSGMGNIVKEPRPAAGGGELCRALSHRTDPEKLKEMGNEEYRQGHYTEAVALYDQAIMMDARRPAYWSNKAAALAALGRLIEAVGDCKEAVRIDPSYDRAHHRLGGLYLSPGGGLVGGARGCHLRRRMGASAVVCRSRRPFSTPGYGRRKEWQLSWRCCRHRRPTATPACAPPNTAGRSRMCSLRVFDYRHRRWPGAHLQLQQVYLHQLCIA